MYFEKAETADSQFRMLQDDYAKLQAKSSATITELEVGIARMLLFNLTAVADGKCEAEGFPGPLASCTESSFFSLHDLVEYSS